MLLAQTKAPRDGHNRTPSYASHAVIPGPSEARSLESITTADWTAARPCENLLPVAMDSGPAGFARVPE
jgi:hypothetical protein